MTETGEEQDEVEDPRVSESRHITLLRVGLTRITGPPTPISIH